MHEPSSAMPDEFDRLLGVLDGLPDVVKTKPATHRAMPFMGVGGSALFIVSTVRQQFEDKPSRDTIFLERVNASGTVRVVLPAEVADMIARQRDALAGKTRSKSARKLAAERKARGEKPGFQLTAAERLERKRLRKAGKK